MVAYSIKRYHMAEEMYNFAIYIEKAKFMAIWPVLKLSHFLVNRERSHHPAPSYCAPIV